MVVLEMTISAYQIDNVIKAYSKQSKAKIRLDVNSAPLQDRYTDVVTLSVSEGLTADTYKKISYNLMDVLLKDKTPAS
jgi:hypothetical protein